MPITTIELETRTRDVAVEIQTRGPHDNNETDIEVRVRTPEVQVRN